MASVSRYYRPPSSLGSGGCEMWLNRLSDRINKIVLYLLFPLLLIMFTVVFIAVVLRLINVSFISSYDISRLFFIWMTLLGMTVIYKKKGHLKFSFLYDKFTGRKKKVVDIIIDLLILIFFFAIMLVSIRFFPKIRIQVLPGSGIPAIWLYMPFFVAPIIMIIHSITFICGYLFQSCKQRDGVQ